MLAPFGAEADTRESAAYRFDIAHIGDVLSNVDGGRRRATRSLHNLDLMLTVGGERAFGWHGATLFAHGFYNNGTRFSKDIVGDAQDVSNITANAEAFRLFEAWVDQRFMDDRLSLRLGLYDLNSEFDVNETGGLFMNGAHGMGTDLGQTGRNGPSVFPVTSLAARAEVKLADNWLMRAAVLDGVPGDPAHPKRTAIKLGQGDGALLAAEVNYLAADLKVALGAWRYTARFEDLATHATRRGNDGFYALVERRLYSEAADPSQGLSVYGRIGRASPAFNNFAMYFGAGAVYSGLFPARPADEFGFAVAWAETGSPRRRTAAGKREVNLELTYSARLHANFAVQPNVQWVINPGADPGLGNALVLGVRLMFDWTIAR